MNIKATILFENDDRTVATWDHLVFVIWKKETTVEGVNHVWSSIKNRGKTFDKGIIMVAIVKQDAAMPTPEARSRLSSGLNDNELNVKASAVVYEGKGFRSAAVRSVVTGLAMVTKQIFPHKVFGDIDESAQWLVAEFAKATKVNIAAADIVSAISSVET